MHFTCSAELVINKFVYQNMIRIIPTRCNILKLKCTKLDFTRAIPKVSGLDVLDNNIFHNLYISETYILYKL